MIRKDFIEKLVKDVREGQVDVGPLTLTVWQKRPYTAVRIEYERQPNEYTFVGLGFTKVSWPDKWDEEEGVNIALLKAAAHIWRQLNGS